MTSSSSLYGAVNEQTTPSTNSTSLYGGADTPIPTPAGDVVVRGDLIVLSGNILTTATTGNIFPANATTVNLGLAATALNIGAGTGTTTINNNLVVDGDITATGGDFGKITIAVADDQTITTTSGELRVGSATGIVKLPSVTSIYTDTTGTFNLLNQPTTVNAFLAATTLNIGANGGETNINNDLLVEGTGTFTGDITAPGADLGNIQIAVADDNTISTTTGGLKLTPFSGEVGLVGVDTLYTDNTGTFNLLNAPTTIYAFDEATTLEIGASSGAGTTVVRNSFAVDGTQIGLAQATNILYSEANDRLNRPAVRSTTGNTSGWRVEAPNATTSAIANISAFSSNDNSNGKFISIQARGAATNDLRIQTGKYTAGVLGATGSVVSFIDNITPYATVNPAGPTDPLDLTTKAYVDALPANVTYTIDATTTTGGANFNLVGSDSTTDTVKFAGSGATTVTRTDANTITVGSTDTNTTYTQNASATTGGANLNLVGSDATTDAVKFASGTGITVSRTDANTITITNSAPDINTTYTQTISSTTGGANLNLVGSDATTDTVKFANGVGVTVAYTDASTATVSIGQSVGTTDNVQFNGVTTNSITTGTVNANGGVSFVNTAPMGTTYATINPFGPFNTDDLTTVGYVNSVLPTVVTYTQDASSTTGGANLNLVGSDSTTDTVKFSGSGATTVTQTSANEITVSSTDTNTTYTQDASTTTGGANVNLVGSDSTTDTIKYAGAGSVTVAATDANTVTITGTDTNTTYTQDVSATTGGGNLNLVGSDSTTDSVKFAGGTNVTVTATDANTLTIAATDTNTTYTIDASSTTGGANLNLVGSDSTTDTVKVAQGTGVSVTQTSANEISVAIGQAVGTGDSPSFAGVSAGNLTVGVATANTIASTDTNGNIVVDPNGSGQIVLSAITRALGELQATTNLNYVFPAQTLNTVTDNNGYSAASSFPAGTNGYGANAGFQHYYGDTLAGTNTAPAFSFRNANGNSTVGDTVPFTGLTSVAPSAVVSGNVMGTLNYAGYATTGFSNDIASQYQGGGINALQAMQVQGYTAEAFSDSILTLTSTNVTAVASSFRVALVTPSVTGTRGQISFGSTTPTVGHAIRVTGTLTGTATGIVSGQTYYIIVTNGTTTATLSATPGGSPIVTTAGTLTGLTLTRCGVTFTMSGLTNVPFGRGALVAVSGVTNVTDGTYPVVGTPTTTSMIIGIPHTVAPTVAGAQTFSCRTAYQGSGFRIRTFPTATPANLQNRLEMVDMTPAATVLRSSTVTFNTGAYGNTGVGITGNNIIYNRVYGQFEYNTTVTPAAINTAYVFPIGTAITSNIATVGSTSRLIPGAAGVYNLQFSAQVKNTNSQEHTAYIFLRKNGVDVANSTGQVTILRQSSQIVSWNYIVTSANATDYFELGYAVEDTQVTFPAFAATGFAPSAAALITTLTPVGA
jgi:hypothetical protein